MANYRSLTGGFFSKAPLDRNVPVSIRTNNPGAVNGAAWERDYPGYVDTDETTPGNKTTIFETPEHGVAVWWELLNRYRAAGVTTVGGIINRYGGGQDYSAYVGFVANQTGLAANRTIDLGDDKTLLLFAKSMFHYEAGRATPLSDAQILYGFRLGRADGVLPGATGPAVSPPQTNWLVALLKALLGLFKKAPPVPPPPPATPTPQTGQPSWLMKAVSFVGFHEVGTNEGIEDFIAMAHTGSLGDPWCAIFVNACLEASGIRGSRSAMARSFEEDTNFVKLDGPALGAVATMWRGSRSAGTGHVFFYLGENDEGVLGLAGNQSDGVKRAYQDRARIVGYYWPKSVPRPKVGRLPVRHDADIVGGSET